MSFKSDVFAQRVTGTGVVFTGRTRLRGISVASNGGGAGRITFLIYVGPEAHTN